MEIYNKVKGIEPKAEDSTAESKDTVTDSESDIPNTMVIDIQDNI